VGEIDLLGWQVVPAHRVDHFSNVREIEIELTSFDQLDQFRRRGVGSSEEAGNWIQAFGEIPVSPPGVAVL
jgi:hypothetical protein